MYSYVHRQQKLDRNHFKPNQKVVNSTKMTSYIKICLGSSSCKITFFHDNTLTISKIFMTRRNSILRLLKPKT